MGQHLSLNGSDWQFKDFYGEDWRWRDAHRPDTRDLRHWRNGTVPGSVHHDLWVLGEIPNPYFERNSLLLEWIPARTWIYKKTFFTSDSLRDKRIHLCFEGVDYEAQFFLNGELLGAHRGMYTPVIFEIQDTLQFGAENLLAVVIEPAPHEQPQVGRTSKVYTHKSRMTYWWDFCPRMVHLGIWDSVYLDITEQVRITDVFIRPQLSADFQQANVTVSLELDASESRSVEIETTIYLDGQPVTSSRTPYTLETVKTSLQQQLTVAQPRLWWTNELGDQPLYEAEICIWRSGDSKVDGCFDDRTVEFGIRKIELIQNENSDPAARPYTFVVNGVKTYIKGWNWVPMDVMYGVPRPEKLEHLLTLAQRAHVNLLRVWGGGLIEKEEFYRQCDQRGIMVWQEFIQSSSGIDNNPPESPEMIAMMIAEAEKIIPRKRNHPSLVIWCGGNELQSAPERPLDDSHPLLNALKTVVEKLDPDRHWLSTSPTGGVFMNSLENIAHDPTALHDVHGPWEYQGVTKHYDLYNQTTSLLHSEFGVEGITNLKTLNATIAPGHQLPVTLDNIYWQHLGAWWTQTRTWQAVFGEITHVKALLHATQFMQAEGLRYAIEANRRRKYQNSGTLPWQFNEPYPMAACTSSVDYYGQAKPAYYAVARAYEVILISARFATVAWGRQQQFNAQIWVNNSTPADFDDARLRTSIIGLSGHIYTQQTTTVNVAPNSAAQLSSIEWQLKQLNETAFFLVTDLLDQYGNGLAHNRYVFTSTPNLAPLVDAPLTELTIRKIEDEDEWTVTIANGGSWAALGVWLEDSRAINAPGYVYFSDNHVSLFPGESTTILVTWHNVPPAERALDISGWNTQKWRV